MDDKLIDNLRSSFRAFIAGTAGGLAAHQLVEGNFSIYLILGIFVLLLLMAFELLTSKILVN